jgi:hypothetical protein
VGEPETASGAFSPDQDGIVRLGLRPEDQVTVFVGGFLKRVIDAAELKASETNVVVVE